MDDMSKDVKRFLKKAIFFEFEGSFCVAKKMGTLRTCLICPSGDFENT